jgi:DNA-binding transcriptional ArsR family regulator
MQGEEQRGTLGTVRNATLLLSLMAEGPAYNQLTDLAERSGMSLPTVHRLLRSLALAGLVEQDPRSLRYGLGSEIVRLSDYNIKPGTRLNMGKGDEWPEIAEKILAAEIIVFATPIWWGNQSSLMQLSRLVFPAPFGPMMAWMSPWETLKVTPSRARTPPNRSVTSRISICTSPGWSVLPFRLCR